jgi:hypothetical protein
MHGHETPLRSLVEGSRARELHEMARNCSGSGGNYSRRALQGTIAYPHSKETLYVPLAALNIELYDFPTRMMNASCTYKAVPCKPVVKVWCEK